MGELFDRYVVVDWSAAARPVTGPNSIWVAVVDGDDDPRLANPSTRRRAERQLGELLVGASRTLVAVDASFGYPAGTAAWFGLGDGEPWRSIWAHVVEHVVDDETNLNNRFHVAAALNRRRRGPGPFWGRPATQPVPGLTTRKPSAPPLPELRIVERRLRAGGRRPASVWQLTGAGSVGSQTLTVLPMLQRLHRPGAVEIWPFTTGLTAPHDGRSVLAETWPTAFDLDGPHPVRDASQVDGVARRLRDADADGVLADWFAPQLGWADRRAVESEEGWALVPPTTIGTAPAV